MKLSAYLNVKKISSRDFAEKIDVAQASVSRYLAGQRTPRPKQLKKIMNATNGEVTANDFIDQVGSEQDKLI